jgi:hypothetical protein
MQIFIFKRTNVISREIGQVPVDSAYIANHNEK